ncbi:MAG: hypothetical protein IT373_11165 [Polyangiaceae bacterium]|nr:hypothetical protein [Polyangiaceae bacterium]
MTRLLARLDATSTRRAARGLRWLWRAVALGGLAAVTTFAACSTEPGDKCVGGKLAADGSCAPLCDPSKCLAGNLCVDNQCLVQCDTEADCYGVVEDCVAGVDDTTGKDVNVCKLNGHAAVGGGWDKSCAFGQVECAASSCPNGFECDVAACGGHPELCVADPVACAGKTPCNVGRCSSDGTPCTVTLCAAAECRPFTCITDGSGDAFSYCAATDCLEDSECATGYYCGEVPVPRELCGSNVGSHPRCGTSLEPCIEPSQLAAPGTRNAAGETYFEGPVCVERRVCLKRAPCADCSSHRDCAALPDQLCIGAEGNAQCQTLCATDAQCLRDETCTPTGFKTCKNAHTTTCAVDADCPVAKCAPTDPAVPEGPKQCAPGGTPCTGEADCADTCLDRNACVPKTGCRPAALPGGFCQHCVADSDCGAAGSNVACADVGGSLSQPEYACFDYSFGVSCTSASQCPTSPSGAHGACLNETHGVDPGSSVYHKCYLPFDAQDGFTCWP